LILVWFGRFKSFVLYCLKAWIGGFFWKFLTDFKGFGLVDLFGSVCSCLHTISIEVFGSSIFERWEAAR
jgi:hypothetical protein